MADPGTDYTKYSRVMGAKLYSKHFGPSKNFKANWAFDMPATLNPNNWKVIAPEEWKAHQERQAIRGRLRREYWTKAYHPVNGKFFNAVTSDPMWSKFQKAKSVYFIRDNFKAKQSYPTLFKVVLVTLVIPYAYFVWTYKKSTNESNRISSLHPRANE